jgi:hypothetical protein
MTHGAESPVFETLITTRVQQEWSLKESLERRAQFLVGAAATGSSLVVAGAGLLANADRNLDKLLESLLLWAAALQIVVGVFALLVVVPVRTRTVTVSSLQNALDKTTGTNQHDASSAIAAAAGVQLRFLKSLERTNGFKVFVLFVATLTQLAALVVLGFAVLEAIDTF